MITGDKSGRRQGNFSPDPGRIFHVHVHSAVHPPQFSCRLTTVSVSHHAQYIWKVSSHLL
jgi:hypothetical protein